MPVVLGMLLGFQHALAMLAGVVTPPIIISSSANFDTLTVGFLLQAIPYMGVVQVREGITDIPYRLNILCQHRLLSAESCQLFKSPGSISMVPRIISEPA